MQIISICQTSNIYNAYIVPLEEKRRMVLKEKLNLATYIFINQNSANVNVSKRLG